MHQNTNILEEVPIYHKTRSAMHLFLTPHQKFEVQRTFGFWRITRHKFIPGIFPIPKCIAPLPPLGALHLGMHQNTNILEAVPIYHKTRSAMHLFLTPHQRECGISQVPNNNPNGSKKRRIESIQGFTKAIGIVPLMSQGTHI
jgi:hypothetical protein